MKKKKTLWNGVSVLIVTVLAIMAFTRGYVQLGLMAVAFTAWSVWAIIRFLVPFVSAKLEKRQAQKIRKHYEEEEACLARPCQLDHLSANHLGQACLEYASTHDEEAHHHDHRRVGEPCQRFAWRQGLAQ